MSIRFWQTSKSGEQIKTCKMYFVALAARSRAIKFKIVCRWPCVDVIGYTALIPNDTPTFTSAFHEVQTLSECSDRSKRASFLFDNIGHVATTN